MPKMETTNNNPIKIPSGTGLPCVISTVGYDSHRRRRLTTHRQTSRDTPINVKYKYNSPSKTRTREEFVGDDDHLFVARNDGIFLLAEMKWMEHAWSVKVSAIDRRHSTRSTIKMNWSISICFIALRTLYAAERFIPTYLLCVLFHSISHCLHGAQINWNEHSSWRSIHDGYP